MAQKMPMTGKWENAILLASKSGSMNGSTFCNFIIKGVCKMKFCPYCGADLVDSTVSFCSECGKELPKEQKDERPVSEEESQSRKPKKKRNRKWIKRRKAKKEPEVEQVQPQDEGYDGYYDDVLPMDDGIQREGIDKELIKKVVLVVVGVLLVVVACVAIMYLL